MARMRDRLIHGYFGVDYELVWNVVQEKIPELHRELHRILQEQHALALFRERERLRFEPARRGGEAVAVRAELPMNWKP